MTAAGRNAPLAPHMRPLLHPDALNGWVITPRASWHNFWGCWGFYEPQNTLMLWQFMIARAMERFEGHKHPQRPQKMHPQALRGYHLSIRCIGTERRASCGALGGHFPLAAAMVVAVVMPVVCCAKANEKRGKNTKLVVCYQKVYL